MANRYEYGVWSPGFMHYMQEAENAKLYKDHTTPVLHESAEGGTKTFGFGHKLNQIEQMSGQLETGRPISEATYEDAVLELAVDLKKAERKAEAEIGPKFNSLSTRAKEMLVDFVFNLGNVTVSFPNFTEAVLKGDIEGQRKEFKRYYEDPDTKNMKPMEERNRLFEERYLTPEAVKRWSRGES